MKHTTIKYDPILGAYMETIDIDENLTHHVPYKQSQTTAQNQTVILKKIFHKNTQR